MFYLSFRSCMTHILTKLRTGFKKCIVLVSSRNPWNFYLNSVCFFIVLCHFEQNLESFWPALKSLVSKDVCLLFLVQILIKGKISTFYFNIYRFLVNLENIWAFAEEMAFKNFPTRIFMTWSRRLIRRFVRERTNRCHTSNKKETFSTFKSNYFDFLYLGHFDRNLEYFMVSI